MPDTYDVIVIGAGPTGENVADYATQAGLSAVIVESELVGGECSYWACIPSKAILRPITALDEARAVDGAKQAATGSIDAAKVFARRDSFTHGWNDESQVKWVANAHFALVRGHGRITGPKRVRVERDGEDDVELEARHAVVVCTGTKSLLPPVPGLKDARAWTNREAVGTSQVPKRLGIVGGGVVASEMAFAFHGLGSQVTVIERGDRLLGRMEDFASAAVADSLREKDVDVRLHTEVTRIQRDQQTGVVTISTANNEVGEQQIECDEVLVAVGRTPRTQDIGLDVVGLKPGDWLQVDDLCRVTAVDGEWLYACGDVNKRNLLTHQGKYQARLVGAALGARARGEEVPNEDWGRYTATADAKACPQVTFTEPEVGSVGLTAAAARAAGMNVKVIDYEIGNTAGGSLYADDYKGRARMVVDESRKVLVGVTFVGAGIGELVHSATIAVVAEVTIDRLWHAVPSYPTISEVWLRLFEAYGR